MITQQTSSECGQRGFFIRGGKELFDRSYLFLYTTIIIVNYVSFVAKFFAYSL